MFFHEYLCASCSAMACNTAIHVPDCGSVHWISKKEHCHLLWFLWIGYCIQHHSHAMRSSDILMQNIAHSSHRCDSYVLFLLQLIEQIIIWPFRNRHGPMAMYLEVYMQALAGQGIMAVGLAVDSWDHMSAMWSCHCSTQALSQEALHICKCLCYHLMHPSRSSYEWLPISYSTPASLEHMGSGHFNRIWNPYDVHCKQGGNYAKHVQPTFKLKTFFSLNNLLSAIHTARQP